MLTNLKSESVLRSEAMEILIRHLGVLDTQRFIASINADRFNYTEWRRDQWDDKTIDELHREASALYQND